MPIAVSSTGAPPPLRKKAVKLYAFIASGFFLSACAIAVLIFYARWIRYTEATQLRAASIGSADFFAIILLIALIIPATLLLLGSLYGMIRRRIGGWVVLLLIAPILLHAGFSLIRFPSFTDVASHTIREKTTEKALVGVAKRFLAAPPKWADPDSEDLDRYEKATSWIRTEPTLAPLALDQSPRVLMKGSTLKFQWGGPLSTRWGMAISSVMGKAPQLSSGEIKTADVFPSVSLYYIPG